jgi:hypothetical protein
VTAITNQACAQLAPALKQSVKRALQPVDFSCKKKPFDNAFLQAYFAFPAQHLVPEDWRQPQMCGLTPNLAM